MFLSVITKNLNWEIFTKSLVTIKWWDEFRMKNFDIMGADWKIQFLGNVHQKPIYRGELPKKGSLDREGGLGEKEGDVFEGGGDTPMHTMNTIARTPFTHFISHRSFLFSLYAELT